MANPYRKSNLDRWVVVSLGPFGGFAYHACTRYPTHRVLSMEFAEKMADLQNLALPNTQPYRAMRYRDALVALAIPWVM